MIRKIIIFAAILMMSVMAIAHEDHDNKGAEQIVLYGGTNGDVNFPHLQHQTALKDCKLCHNLFPQQPGVIQKLKDAKELKKKQVMNTQCLQCHRTKKREGSKTGPTSCKKCHIKK